MLRLQGSQAGREGGRIALIDRLQRGKNARRCVTHGQQCTSALNVDDQAFAGMMLALKVEIQLCGLAHE